MLTIELLEWPKAQKEAQRIRFTVFVDEQKVPPELEMDEHDATSVHALAFWGNASSGKAVGTGRLLPDGHIGRMAVLKEWRGRGVGQAMLRALIDAGRQRGDPDLVLNSQVHALAFYAAEGFKAEGPVYEEAGIPHQVMRLKLR
ncbi:MAG: GNAT family N-acetyltransferase [Betaproteobacteria bacterium]|nr:GNAT family N-acetyltransferase [Betaproteobacteria bacterium]